MHHLPHVVAVHVARNRLRLGALLVAEGDDRLCAVVAHREGDFAGHARLAAVRRDEHGVALCLDVHVLVQHRLQRHVLHGGLRELDGCPAHLAQAVVQARVAQVVVAAVAAPALPLLRLRAPLAAVAHPRHDGHRAVVQRVVRVRRRLALLDLPALPHPRLLPAAAPVRRLDGAAGVLADRALSPRRVRAVVPVHGDVRLPPDAEVSADGRRLLAQGADAGRQLVGDEGARQDAVAVPALDEEVGDRARQLAGVDLAREGLAVPAVHRIREGRAHEVCSVHRQRLPHDLDEHLPRQVGDAVQSDQHNQQPPDGHEARHQDEVERVVEAPPVRRRRARVQPEHLRPTVVAPQHHPRRHPLTLEPVRVAAGPAARVPDHERARVHLRLALGGRHHDTPGLRPRQLRYPGDHFLRDDAALVHVPRDVTLDAPGHGPHHPRVEDAQLVAQHLPFVQQRPPRDGAPARRHHLLDRLRHRPQEGRQGAHPDARRDLRQAPLRQLHLLAVAAELRRPAAAQRGRDVQGRRQHVEPADVPPAAAEPAELDARREVAADDDLDDTDLAAHAALVQVRVLLPTGARLAHLLLVAADAHGLPDRQTRERLLLLLLRRRRGSLRLRVPTRHDGGGEDVAGCRACGDQRLVVLRAHNLREVDGAAGGGRDPVDGAREQRPVGGDLETQHNVGLVFRFAVAGRLEGGRVHVLLEPRHQRVVLVASVFAQQLATRLHRHPGDGGDLVHVLALHAHACACACAPQRVEERRAARVHPAPTKAAVRRAATVAADAGVRVCVWEREGGERRGCVLTSRLVLRPLKHQ
eukprot:Rhum_TRINITY_DN14163_c1_g1::Rhum_TRINITY_DN14163_c1_g1_i1::g.69340::m.69340